jgi:hypothetical protein
VVEALNSRPTSPLLPPAPLLLEALVTAEQWLRLARSQELWAAVVVVQLREILQADADEAQG